MLDNSNRTTHYIRTDKAIVHAFCALLRQKSYADITVQDILDATPISRAAFYQHFLDKEAIGEQLLNEYFAMLQNITKEMGQKGESHYVEIVQKAMSAHQEEVEALLQIHTDKVDLKSRVYDILKDVYLKNSKSKYKELESCVYAAAMAEFQLASQSTVDIANAGDPNIYNTVMINIFLKIMNWENNKNVKEYLLSQFK